MPQIRFHSFLMTFASGLVLFFGIGLSHVLLSGQSTAHGTSEIASQCQSTCPPIIKEGTLQSEFVNDENDPPFTPAIFSLSAADVNALYLFALIVISLAYLRSRPPDLLIQFAYRRN